MSSDCTPCPTETYWAQVARSPESRSRSCSDGGRVEWFINDGPMPALTHWVSNDRRAPLRRDRHRGSHEQAHAIREVSETTREVRDESSVPGVVGEVNSDAGPQRRQPPADRRQCSSNTESSPGSQRHDCVIGQAAAKMVTTETLIVRTDQATIRPGPVERGRLRSNPQATAAAQPIGIQMCELPVP